MGVLRDLTNGDAVPLASRIVVGRAPTATLRVADKRVSGEHATVAWTGGAWEVRDLGSRNGTYVDGARLATGSSCSIARGARLGFGTDTATFVLEDAGAPGPVARDAASGALRAAVDGILPLPSAEEPDLVVYADERGRWIAEQGDVRRELGDGDTVAAGGRVFVVATPAPVEGTAAADDHPRLDTVALRFAVSRDEEHVRITLVHRGRELRLDEREHAYVLLTLARRRLEDRAEPAGEQGWIDRDHLLRMLHLDPNGLNVAIYRARGQLAAAGLEGAAGIVEVRRGQRRIAVDPDRLAVEAM